MSKIIQIGLISILKLGILTTGLYLVCTTALTVYEASAPSAKNICDRVQLGMTVGQIDAVTRTFEGWQVLRDDGVMVISTRSYRDKSPVCRIAVDPNTDRATSKSTGPLQHGDWPTL